MSTVKCPICQKHFKEINKSHLNRHSLTVGEYDTIYPNHPRMSEEQKKSKIRYQNITDEMSQKLKYSHTEEGYIEKYGIDLGKEKFKARNANIKNSKSLENYIKKFGKEEGVRKYNAFIAKQKTKMTVESFQEKYGEVEGRERYDLYITNNSISNSREHYQKIHGVDKGNLIFDEKSKKQSMKIRKVPLEEMSDWELYKQLVTKHTRRSLKDNGHTLENFDKRGRGKGKYHVDHMLSVYECFKNSVSPAVCGSIHNLIMITCEENSSKQEKSSITLEHLLSKMSK